MNRNRAEKTGDARRDAGRTRETETSHRSGERDTKVRRERQNDERTEKRKRARREVLKLIRGEMLGGLQTAVEWWR